MVAMLWLCTAVTMACAIVPRSPSECPTDERAVSRSRESDIRREPGPSPAEAPVAPLANCADYLAEIQRELEKTWPDNRTITVVCHGHSVPAGYFATPIVDSVNAYPHVLFTKLKKRYPNAVVSIIVTAIGGENAVSGAARFERDVLRHRPDVVTIDYALNDRENGLVRSRLAWEEMIACAKAHGVKVILLTPTPDQESDLDDPNDQLNQHARQVRELAAVHGVGLVDSLALFQQHIEAGRQLADLMSQSNHPNAAGHELVAAGLIQCFVQDGMNADGG